MVTEQHLDPWKPRRALLDPYVEDSMCRLTRAARADANAQSLALIRPREIHGLDVEPHPGWTPDEQRKIDAYIQQPDLFSGPDRTALEPPRSRAFYRYHCHDAGCGGHRQGVLDWELVAFQRRLTEYHNEQLRQAIREKFLDELCAPGRDPPFYVGNQGQADERVQRAGCPLAAARIDTEAEVPLNLLDDQLIVQIRPGNPAPRQSRETSTHRPPLPARAEAEQ